MIERPLVMKNGEVVPADVDDLGGEARILLALQIERTLMQVERRAFRAEMQSRPVTDVAALAAAAPEAPHLLAAADAYAATLGPYSAIGAIWNDVQQFIRLHPDVATVREALLVTDEWIDDLFRAAMARENI